MIANPLGPNVLEATKGHFDSLAVEADGTIVVAAIGHGLCVVQPDGSGHEYVEVPDTASPPTSASVATTGTPRSSRCRASGALVRLRLAAAGPGRSN